LYLIQISKRLVISEAPGLNIGMGITRVHESTSRVVIKNRETLAIGGIKKESSEEDNEIMVFITANILTK